MKTIKLLPLTRESFKPFGDVLLADDMAKHYEINNGRCVRYHNLATSAISGDSNGNDGAATITSLFRGKNAPLPFMLEVMERHPLGSQMFLPMTPRPYVVVVAATTTPPTEKDLVGFIVRPQGDSLVGVNYYKNVWHHPLIAMREESDKTAPVATTDFWVVDRLGAGNNLQEIDITPWQIYLEK
ncbi:MAG: ureidoglycolate lyase [Hydrotalea sp.]|nr:ureidoglycolate lyase [Hydrotalea sp.]